MIQSKLVLRTNIEQEIVFRGRTIDTASIGSAEFTDKEFNKLDKFLSNATPEQKLCISNFAALLKEEEFYVYLDDAVCTEADALVPIPADFSLTDEIFFAIIAQCPSVINLKQFLVYDGADLDSIEFKPTLQEAVKCVREWSEDLDDFEIIDLETLERYEVKAVYQAVKKIKKKV